jgi:hypothetical protein
VGVRRWLVATAATARGSGEERRTDDNMLLGEVLRVLWERVRRSVGGRSDRSCGSPAAAATMEGGGSVGAQRGKWRRVNRALAGRG